MSNEFIFNPDLASFSLIDLPSSEEVHILTRLHPREGWTGIISLQVYLSMGASPGTLCGSHKGQSAFLSVSVCVCVSRFASISISAGISISTGISAEICVCMSFSNSYFRLIASFHLSLYLPLSHPHFICRSFTLFLLCLTCPGILSLCVSLSLPFFDSLSLLFVS